MPNTYDPRERAVEAGRLLNSFLLDFVVGIRGLEIFDCPAIAPSVSRTTAIGLNRMAISHVGDSEEGQEPKEVSVSQPLRTAQ
jgi:hypothetical protein